MKHCADCRIYAADDEKDCPLCRGVLEDAGSEGDFLPHDSGAASDTSRPPFEPEKRRDRRLAAAFSKTAVLLMITSAVINAMIPGEVRWSVIFSAAVLYIWLLGMLTLRRTIHPGLKLTAHAVAIPLLLIAVNAFASGEGPFRNVTWAVSWAAPVILIGFILTIDILIFRRRQNLRNYLLYQLSLCVIGFVPLILVLCGAAKPAEPGIAAAACSFLSILALILSAPRIVIAELGRKFHI